MRASTFMTLVAAFGFSAASASAALADEYRGPLQSIDTARGTIRVIGVTIQANGHPLGGLNLSSNYIVNWQQKGSDNVLMSIQPDTSSK